MPHGGGCRGFVPIAGRALGEITQLRGSDVIEREGMHALLITPEAGTVKNRKARVVPLHEHLIEQGFLDFVANHGDGPLFYTRARKQDRPTRRRASALLRGCAVLGFRTRSCSRTTHGGTLSNKLPTTQEFPNACRTTITGHAQTNVGASTAPPTLQQMAEALKKFPRYEM